MSNPQVLSEKVDELASLSDKVCPFEQKEEWALLHRCGIHKISFGDGTKGPELEPVEVVRPHLDIIIHSAMLEEELLVTPEGRDGVRPGYDPAYQLIFATALRGLIECHYLEQDGVHRNN